MAMPPEYVRVKRLRAEEPIEVLGIEREGRTDHETKRVFTYTHFMFRRISDGILVALLHFQDFHLSVWPESTSPKVPTVRTTLPGEENVASNQRSVLQQPAMQSRAVAPGVLLQPTSQTTAATTGLSSRQAEELKTTDKAKVKREPKRFHMATRPFSINASPQLPRRHGKANGRTRPLADLATFQELRSKFKHQSPKKKPGSTKRNASSGYGTSPTKSLRESQRRRKPNASAVERRWRDDNWKRHPDRSDLSEELVNDIKGVADANDELDSETMKLQEAMQRFALEMNVDIPGRGSTTEETKDGQQCLGDLAERSDDDQSEEVKSEEDEDDSKWVYDTYVRHTRKVPEADSVSSDKAGELLDSLHAYGFDRVGVLVITNEDEELWEYYGEGDTDDEHDSEDEDENAEDYYANDYPEDEVDADDELGYRAYNYRHDASDDEEYDLTVDDQAWSSDEEEKDKTRGW